MTLTEKSEFNQYWYSPETIDTIVSELVEYGKETRIAFLSTPTVWISACKFALIGDLFEFDASFARHANDECQFIQYDFNNPSDVPPNHKYDIAVIDPPFITEKVLKAYFITCDEILNSCGKIIISTIAENADILNKVSGQSFTPVKFQPSIPNLVYQYSLFVNYKISEQSPFNKINANI